MVRRRRLSVDFRCLSISDFGVFQVNLLDFPGQRTIAVRRIIDGIPGVVPVPGQDLFGGDVPVGPDAVGDREDGIKPGDVLNRTDEELLPLALHPDGDVGDTLAIDGDMEPAGIDDFIVLEHDRLIVDAKLGEYISQEVGGITATAREQTVAFHILIDLLVEFIEEIEGDFAFHIVICYFLLRRYK